jgi:polysaccharide pyruvyl transferase WcaK-like protein
MPDGRRISILVDHGEGFTVGDDAMLCAVVDDLRRELNGNVEFSVTRPRDGFGRALEGASDVEWAPSPSRCAWEDWPVVSRLLERGYRWNLPPKLQRLLAARAGRRLARVLTKQGGTDTPTGLLADALARADAVHLVGGGYLNDIWAHTMVQPKWGLVRAARAMGVPVFITGQGVGPLRKRGAIRAVRGMVEAAERFALREKLTSPGLLADIGCDPGAFGFVGDDALSLRPADPAPLLREAGVALPDEYLCASIRFAYYAQDYQAHTTAIAGLLDSLVEQAGLPLVFVPMSMTQTCDDAASARSVVEQMRCRDRCQVIDSYPLPGQALAVAAGARLSVALSYHFGLLALGAGVPTLLLHRGSYYQGKMTGLADCFAAPELALSMDQLSDPGDKVARLIRESDALSQRLGSVADEMRESVAAERRAEVAGIRASLSGPA